MYDRQLASRLTAALADTPVVLLHGARQTGKSTLAQQVASGPHPALYLTLDDAVVLSAAKTDPGGFIANLRGPVVIDEVQRAPELFLPIKAAVDRNRHPGRFLLTGSANIFLVPRLSESLAGRMVILTLYPLAQVEIEATGEGLVDRLFSDVPLSTGVVTTDRDDVIRRLVVGGYPEVLDRSSDRRNEWFASYVTTILQKDVRDLAQRVERLTEFPRLMAVLATRTGTLLNVADISRVLGIPYMTLSRYLTLLQATFLVQLVPAWTASTRRRFLKAPKIVMQDTGLAAHLVSTDPVRIASDPDLLGGLLETFVVTELIKQATWSRTQPSCNHYRTTTGEEVDLVLEDRSGRVVGVEVKAAATIGKGHFKGLRGLAGVSGPKFHRGVLFYLGEAIVPFGDRLFAVPVPALWRPHPQ